jgi:MFS family permease
MRAGARPGRAFTRDALTWVLYVVFSFSGTVTSGLGPSLDGLRTELALSHVEASLHSSLFAVGSIVTGLTGSALIRAIGLRGTLWASVAGTAVGLLVLGVGRVLPVTMAGALLTGVGSSMQVVVVMTILSGHHGPNRPAAFAEVNSIASGVGAIAPLLIGTSIAMGWTWRPGYAAGAIAAIPVLFLLSRFVAIPGRSAALDTRALGGLPRPFWTYWLVLVFVVAIEFCIALWTTTFLRERFGLEPAVASAAFAAFPVGMVISRALAGRLVLGRTAEQIALAALLATAVGFSVFWLSPVAPASVVGILVAGLGVGPLYPMTLGLAIAPAPELAALAASRGTMASGVAILVAPFTLGALADLAGLGLAFGVVVIFIILAAVLLLAAHRSVEHTRPQGPCVEGRHPA